MGHKTKRGESYFLVRWKGYGKESDSWEPEAELNCDDLIEEYRKKVSPNPRLHLAIVHLFRSLMTMRRARCVVPF